MEEEHLCDDAVPVKAVSPEALAALLGTEPLAKAQHHFESREQMLRAYAKVLREAFAAATADAERCDLCERRATAAAWLKVTWSGRLRWSVKGLVVTLGLFAILVPAPWALVLVVLVARAAGQRDIIKQLEHMSIEQRIRFRTVHPLCESCLWQLRFRRGMNFALRVVGGFVGSIGVIIALLVCLYLIGGLTGAQRANRNDLLWAAWFLVPASILCLLAIAMVRFANWRVLYPASVRRLAKRPFRADDMAVARRGSDGSLVNATLEWEWLR